MKSINEIDFSEKKAFLRVDFNVPFDDAGQVSDNSRILAALPTIKYILSRGGSCILASHLGRPKGKTKELSLSKLVPELEKLLRLKVLFSEDCIGEKTESICSNLKPGEVILLENLRFYEEETNADESFAKKLFKKFGVDCQINEDYELNIRIRKSGKLVTVNENLEVSYYVRNSLFGLVKQFFRYGLWKTKTLSIHPDSLKKRQLAPVLFVLFLVSLGIGYSILPYYQVLNWIIGIVGFLWLILIISIWKNSPRIINIFLIPIVVLSMHISWGVGFLFGLTRWIRGGWKS